ncbi:hypothetical protein IL306_013232, partial [Fusarium sp. DS 682]
MTGFLRCSGQLSNVTLGNIYSREIVLVANITEEDPKGFFMYRTPIDAERAFSTAKEWLDLYSSPDFDFDKPNNSEIAVDFTMSRADQVLIQWANTDPWNDDYDAALPVARRITYTMHYAVAEVRREVHAKSCARLVDPQDPVQIFSFDNSPPISKEKSEDPYNTVYLKWIIPMIATWAGDARTGVSSIVQVAMTIFI